MAKELSLKEIQDITNRVSASQTEKRAAEIIAKTMTAAGDPYVTALRGDGRTVITNLVKSYIITKQGGKWKVEDEEAAYWRDKYANDPIWGNKHK